MSNHGKKWTKNRGIFCEKNKPLLLTVSEIFNVKCNAMADVTLIRPLNKGQGWYQLISHIRLPIGCQ